MALAAMALNFLLGFTGVLSFGHAAYFGLGAYGVGMTHQIPRAQHVARHPGRACWPARSPRRSIGALIVRLRGVYFAMVTIAFGQVFYFIAFRWNVVTGGDDGLGGWQRQPLDFGFAQIDILSNDKAFYYLVLLCFAISAGVMALLLRSPFGRTLLAIRENERRARFLGIPVRAAHLAVLRDLLRRSSAWPARSTRCSTISSIRARCTGSMSGDFVIMAVLGGMRSFWGPLIGAAIFVVLQD